MTRARVKGDGAFTETAPELRKVDDLTGDTLATAQAWLEDKVVRAVREQGYCAESLRVMDTVFGKPLDEVGVYDTRGNYGQGYGSARAGRLYPAYLDSNGKDCWENEWRDKDGYNRAGLNQEGRDKDGYNKDGRDKEGFDRDGKDANGISRDDPARFAFGPDGFNVEGYNGNGYDRHGFNREGRDMLGRERGTDRFVFDSNGYDIAGFNRDGYNRQGGFSADVSEKYRRIRRGL